MRYEDLREHALTHPEHRGGGLTLFVERGVVAWMRAWPVNTSGNEKMPARPMEKMFLAGSTTSGTIDAGLREPVVAILVNMVLGYQRELCG